MIELGPELCGFTVSDETRIRICIKPAGHKSPNHLFRTVVRAEVGKNPET